MTGNTYLQTRGQQRDSSIELFRILATFMVLVVHFTGWFVGGVSDPFDSSIPVAFRIGQPIIEAICIVCVNCFLIISGWFGLSLKFRSFWKLYTQLVFIYIPIYLLYSLYSGDFSILELIDRLLVFTKENYYIQCYAVLILLSPILNSFFEKYGRKSLPLVLVLWGVEAFMENIRGNISLGINSGYSIVHFVLIYLLARAASLYKDMIIKVKKSTWLIGYFMCAIIICLLHLAGFSHTWDYSNPIVVIESFCLFFVFLYKPFYNKTINWISASTLAVYIIHITHPMPTLFRTIDIFLLTNLPYAIYILAYFGICAIIFICCIFYDKCRIKLTNSLMEYTYSNLLKSFKSLAIHNSK